MKRLTSTITLLLAAVAPAMALDTDRNQPIRIQADSSVVDENRGSAVYRGNVIITQGTLEVSADEVEIHTVDRQVTRIVARGDKASGKLAHYQQQAGQDMVFADARSITYLVREEHLHLAGSARLQQVQDVFTGEQLYYDIGDGIVNLDSGGGDDRINMTLTPGTSQQ